MVYKQASLMVVVLLLGSVFAQADTLSITGSANIYDCWVGSTYNDKYTGTGTSVREYWASNDYDYRAFIRVDLSSIPSGSAITSASMNLKLLSTGNSNPINIDLWKVSAFTTAVTARKYDGVNVWPDGVFDGIDGWAHTPESKLLATMAVDSSMADSVIEFSGLTEYIQAQSNLGEGQRYAYFELSSRDEGAEYVTTFYSSRADAANQPFLSVSYVPEPVTLVLFAIGAIGGIRRKN